MEDGMVPTGVLKGDMATEKKQKAPQPVEVPSSREERIAAWLKANQKLVGMATGGILVVVLATWFLSASAARKEAFAQAQLEQAWSLQDAGNLPQAAAELQRVASSYGGTEAALEARLSLNQTRLMMGQAQLAIEDLEAFVSSGPPGRFLTRGLMLLGAAQENQGEFAQAAASYSRAAQAAEMEFAKADALLSAGRSYAAAGDQGQAEGVLRRIVEEFPETPAAPVAELRLAELSRGR